MSPVCALFAMAEIPTIPVSLKMLWNAVQFCAQEYLFNTRV
jgi:hypothetical protein